MPFVNYQVMPFGWRANRRRILRKSFSAVDYNDFAFDDNDFKIAFYTRSGVLLGYLFTGIKDPIIVNMVFTNDLRGCASGYIELSELPQFPIPTYCEVVISFQGDNLYNGYAWKPTTQETTRNQIYKIEFFGLRKKYESIPINLEYTSIGSITQTLTTSRVNFNAPLPAGAVIGAKIANRNCENEANNGYYTITAINSGAAPYFAFPSWVQYTNAAGVTQATAVGSAAFLPLEWSTNVLVSEAFSQICTAYGSGLGIEYSAGLIEESTGLSVGGMRDHDGLTIQKAFELLEKLARGQYAMGVNEDGYYFFKAIETDPLRKFIMGYDVNKQAVTTNYDNIKNTINVNRAKGKGEPGNGWITAASSFDSTSIAKWGSATKDITVPDFIDDATAQIIADSELENLKDPKQHAKVESIKFDGLLEIGNYGIVSPFGEYTTIVDEMDSITDWVVNSFVGFSADSTVLVTGAASIYMNRAVPPGNAYKLYNIDARGKKFLKFWMYAINLGTYTRVKINNNASYQIDVTVETINDWFLVEWDISSYPFDTITRIDFTYFDVTEVRRVHIDEISLVSYTAIHTDLPYKQATYNLKAHDRTVTLELGLQQDSLSEYLANVSNAIETNNLLLKDRSNT